jgi:CheY-like chemotaxis protein
MPSPKLKILVIGASGESSIAMPLALCCRSYALTRVELPDEAVRLLVKDRFALVILDLTLPAADGFATAARIRNSQDPEVPILFLSACDGNDESVAKAFGLGRIDFLRKPAGPEALKAKVETFAALRRQELQIRKQAKELAATKLKLVRANRKLLQRSDELIELQGEQKLSGWGTARLNEELAGCQDSSLLTQESRRLFLTRLSHEIRTPMTGILGMIDFTLNSNLNPDQANQLQIAKNAGKALVKVLNDLLNCGRPATIAPPQPAAPPGHPGTPPAQELTVLIAEDDPVIMGLMAMLTAKAGHRVLTASDGYEALKVWESEQPGLVLMDVQMPNLDGLEATRRIRSREREIGGQVPIYGLTAFVMDEDINKCLAAGMTGHVSKPIDFPLVLEIMKKHQRQQ